MVLGHISHESHSESQVKCDPIWPKHTKGAGLDFMGLTADDVNDPRNFLRLHGAIEKAVKRKQIYFERIVTANPDDIQLKVVVLEPDLLSQSILQGGHDIIQFRDIDGAVFHYVFTKDKSPFRNLISAAIKKGWIEDDPNTKAH